LYIVAMHIIYLCNVYIYPRVPIIRTHNKVHVKKSFQNCFLSNQIHFLLLHSFYIAHYLILKLLKALSIKQIFAF